MHWDKKRKRWIATVTIGYDGRGKRLVKRGSGRTKTEAKNTLRRVLRDREDGLPVADDSYSVAHAVKEWLAYGLANRDPQTVKKNGHLCRTHVFPHLGKKKLRDLTATDVDKWLTKLAQSLSTRTIREVRACLNRAIMRAMARDKVKRNVVGVTDIPRGRPGRSSKAFTSSQAHRIIDVLVGHRLHPYIVVSMLTGARTEEVRALRWEHVHLEADPPFVEVWRSVRAGGDTKTRKSRRTLALPELCVDAFIEQKRNQHQEKVEAGENWQENGLVFTTSVGTAMDAANVRRSFRSALGQVPGIDPKKWTPRELRHSFVSLLSDSGMPIEEISRLAGHSSSAVTELVYRHQIRPVIQTGATAMNHIFSDSRSE